MSKAPKEPTTIEPLEDYLRRIEGAHIARDVYAVSATHPEATERVWPGTYSGISLSAGPVSVRYSRTATPIAAPRLSCFMS